MLPSLSVHSVAIPLVVNERSKHSNVDVLVLVLLVVLVGVDDVVELLVLVLVLDEVLVVSMAEVGAGGSASF